MTIASDNCPQCGSSAPIRRAFSYDYCAACGWKGEDNCCELQRPRFGRCRCQCHKVRADHDPQVMQTLRRHADAQVAALMRRGTE